MNKYIRNYALLVISAFPSIFLAQPTFENFDQNTPIVIRFKTNQKKIEILEKHKPKKAEKYKAEQMQEHQDYYEAFTDHYSFGPVYFMYSDSSISLLKGKKHNLFLNRDLKVDSTIVLEQDQFLVADIGEMDSDHMGLDCFFVRDEQLRYPTVKFPYYVKRNKGGPLKTFFYSLFLGWKAIVWKQPRRPVDVAQILQENFQNYIQKKP